MYSALVHLKRMGLQLDENMMAYIAHCRFVRKNERESILDDCIASALVCHF